MSNIYNLDSLRADLDREFAPYKLTLGSETIVLRNLMRVGAKERQAVMESLKVIEAVQDEEKEQTPEDVAALSEAVETILVNVVADGKGPELARALGGDLLLSMKVLEGWTGATQPGEAQNSSA